MRGVKRIKYIFAAVIGLAALLLLSGCNEGPWLFTSGQAREHLENWYPGEDIEMQADGLNTWLCWFKDLPEAQFRVELVTRGGDPVPCYHNRLDSNAPDAVWTYYLDAYRKEGGCLDAWEISKAKWADETCMELEYTSMAQVREAAEQLRAFYGWTEGRPHREFLAKGRYYYLFSGALPWQTSLSEKIDVCTQGPEDSLDDVLGQCAGALMEYYAFYNLPCDDFTAEELAGFARGRWDWVTMSGCPEVRDGEERLPGELFAGIGADHLHISYGGLYELLVRLDMAVEGTLEHFWVTGADGAGYEFSYDFHREAHSKEDETHIIWYFLRNGYMVDTSHESAWYLSWWDYGPLLRLDKGQHYQTDENHFRWDTIPELITGLRFKWSAP